MSELARTLVLTGTSRGIGRAAVSRLRARLPRAHLVELRRTADQDAPALTRVDEQTWQVGCDLTSLVGVRQAGQVVAEALGSGVLPPLQALVCNAGVQHTNALTATRDGLESTFAVNVVANHCLIGALGQRLGAGTRIVISVSDTHFGDLRHNLALVPGPQWHAVEHLAQVGTFAKPATAAAGRRAYSTSKLAAIYYLHEFARRFPQGPRIVGFNPGFVPARVWPGMPARCRGSPCDG